jgi:hypothetical protein
MASQKQLSQAGLPACIPVRTKKDKLYNDFLGLLSEENMHFTTADVDSLGKIFVKTIVECLWYVDGHHEKLKRQSAPIPDYFGRLATIFLSFPNTGKGSTPIYLLQYSNHCRHHFFRISKRLFGTTYHSGSFKSTLNYLPKAWRTIRTTSPHRTRR